jgi:hypothetical protein
MYIQYEQILLHLVKHSLLFIKNYSSHLDGWCADNCEEDPLADEGLADGNILRLLEELVVAERLLERVLLRNDSSC